MYIFTTFLFDIYLTRMQECSCSLFQKCIFAWIITTDIEHPFLSFDIAIISSSDSQRIRSILGTRIGTRVKNFSLNFYIQHLISNKKDMKSHTITWNIKIINFWFRSARWTKINSEQLNLNFELFESQNDKGGLRVLSRSWRLSA